MTHKTIRNCIFIFLLMFASFLCIQKASNHGLALWDLENGNTVFYQGNYTLQIINLGHNTTYNFVLQNGDSIRVPSEYVDNREELKLLQNSDCLPKMLFHYSRHKSCIDLGMCVPLSITSIPDGTTYVNETTMITAMHNEIFLYIILGVPPACIAITVLIFVIATDTRCTKLWRKLRFQFGKK